ncbi:DEAD/DEAH box helicase [Sporosarcina sp. ITBMC105]
MDNMEIISCRLEMTNRAKKEIGNWAIDEHALFGIQDHFTVHIEKQPAKQDNMTFSFYFDPQTNTQLSNFLNERVAVLECVYKNEGFLATSFRVKGRKEPVRTNRRIGVRLTFDLNRRTGSPVPIGLYTRLRELPIAQERSEYVEKRIASWEGYLKIEEKNADVADVTAQFSNPIVNESFTELTVTCSGLDAKDWQTITGFSAKLQGATSDLGTVIDVQRGKRIVKIELNKKQQAVARRGGLLPKGVRELTFSNFAELSQIRRLRKGFKDLQDGFAANANLEKVLFEERPVVQITNKRLALDFHHSLNEFQQEAVTGALSANDLFVIQGPPGTGKTTVISELCHQLMKAGKRTLVASQSNLAVDNALGRLLSDPGIRILRYGRTESIEEEGKRFIEENVALHWRDETLAAVDAQRIEHSEREQRLKQQLTELKERIHQLEVELETVAEQIVQKQTAKEEYKKQKVTLADREQRIAAVQATLAELQLQQQQLKALDEQLLTQKKQCEELHQQTALDEAAIEEMAKKASEMSLHQKRLRYFQTIEAITFAEMEIRKQEAQLSRFAEQLKPYPSFVDKLVTVRKLQELDEVFTVHGLKPSLSATLEMNALRRLRVEIVNGTYPYELLEWKEVAERLAAGVTYAKDLLQKHQFPLETVMNKENHNYTTPEEMHEMLDKMSRFFVLPATKKTLLMVGSPQKTVLLQRLADNLSYLLGKQSEVRKNMSIIKTASDKESAARFSALIREIKEEMQLAADELKNQMTASEQAITEHQKQLRHLQEESVELVHVVDEQTTRNEVEHQLIELEKEMLAFETRKATFEQAERALGECMERQNEIQQQLKQNQAALTERSDEQTQLKEEIRSLEQQLHVLEGMLRTEPEQRKKAIREEIDVQAEEVVKLQQEIEQMPLTKALQDEWREMLATASDYDLDEIRKLYVKHANVIGTTCVASARKDFMDDYPTFDVVIIDEVSKATPPELLLPMLKGKKIILVGDHHQLPPLVGRETMEEFIEEIKDEKEKNVLRGMLKESLFERLFRSLPKQNKTMLGIQYRMHEDIMHTITPFYAAGQYRLQCGLADSNTARDHRLTSRFIERNDHLLWFDMPNEPAYFEAQVKGGTSLYNESELEMIRELLVDIESATDEAKRDGCMQADEKKSVGVISFYGEQVKRIDRLIEQEIMPKHLHCRTGSVDKFQGMEMDIIILSFVRNHQQPSGTIGFAEDYRRLNVALSRARELLIIVGSSDMFMKRPKKAETREMYTRLVENVKTKGGFKELSVERNG